jgi:hypothetical protein
VQNFGAKTPDWCPFPPKGHERNWAVKLRRMKETQGSVKWILVNWRRVCLFWQLRVRIHIIGERLILYCEQAKAKI